MLCSILLESTACCVCGVSKTGCQMMTPIYLQIANIVLRTLFPKLMIKICELVNYGTGGLLDK